MLSVCLKQNVLTDMKEKKKKITSVIASKSY